MKKSMLRKLSVALCLVFITSLPAFAHKVRIFAWEDGDTIVAESKFSGGRPAQNATVTVIDSASGKPLLNGTTDEEGVFRFPRPSGIKGSIEIIINGGDGHKNSWLYSMSDSEETTESVEPIHPPAETPLSSAGSSINEDQLQKIIEQALDKKLGPIKRSLAEATDSGPTLQDILGGIGYIFGLAGIAAYFQSRKKDKE